MDILYKNFLKGTDYIQNIFYYSSDLEIDLEGSGIMNSFLYVDCKLNSLSNNYHAEDIPLE